MPAYFAGCTVTDPHSGLAVGCKPDLVHPTRDLKGNGPLLGDLPSRLAINPGARGKEPTLLDHEGAAGDCR